MKKRNLKSLSLNKNSISNLKSIYGGALTFSNCNTNNNCYTDFHKCSNVYCISNHPFLPACASDNPFDNKPTLTDC